MELGAFLVGACFIVRYTDNVSTKIFVIWLYNAGIGKTDGNHSQDLSINRRLLQTVDFSIQY